MNTAADLRWLRKADHWGEWHRFSDTEIAAPESIWLLKSGTSAEARFYAVGQGQVGPRHKSIVAAYYWAYGNRWLQADGDMGIELACRREVMAGGGK